MFHIGRNEKAQTLFSVSVEAHYSVHSGTFPVTHNPYIFLKLYVMIALSKTNLKIFYAV